MTRGSGKPLLSVSDRRRCRLFKAAAVAPPDRGISGAASFQSDGLSDGEIMTKSRLRRGRRPLPLLLRRRGEGAPD